MADGRIGGLDVERYQWKRAERTGGPNEPDSVPAAVNQALSRAKQLHADAVRSLTAGLELPGLEEALAQVTGAPPPA